MINFLKKFKSILIKTAILIILVVLFVILLSLKNNQDIAEGYSRTIARWLTTPIGAFAYILPFSLTEISFAIVVVFLVITLILLIIDLVKRRWQKGINKAVTIGLVIFGSITWYFASAEMQYNRKPLPLNGYEEKVEKEDFRGIIEYFIEDYNYCSSQLTYDENGRLILPYSINKVNSLIAEEYKKLDDAQYNGYFAKFTSRVKPLISSPIFTQFHITGITVDCFGEPNFNTTIPAAEYAFTMAHEIAHQKGVMKEDDANYVSLYLLLQSEDPYLRYSAYDSSFFSFFNLAYLTGNDNDAAELLSSINPKIIKDYNLAVKFWQDNNMAQEFSDWWNDLYLKSSGTEGTSSYNDTPIEIDKETEVIISFSRWQKLYFKIYYQN
ncbi:MAG: DUF3810 domain-containing protein [Bacilli bacterium]|nr:DUF3810 domain-containing protein [Bacilli bacterium]